jgi:guanylate kinase
MVSKRKGSLIVLSAPSGGGKTSICEALLRDNKNLIYSISATTRPPRGDEKEGLEYFFMSLKKFQSIIKRNGFAEWAYVHKNYYGTPKSFLNKAVREGKDVLLDIDVQGGMSIKKCFPCACLIFIKPPSLEVLRTRLINRNQDDAETIKTRLINAKKEMAYIKKYDYVVVNQKLDESIRAVKTIIEALKYKI